MLFVQLRGAFLLSTKSCGQKHPAIHQFFANLLKILNTMVVLYCSDVCIVQDVPSILYTTIVMEGVMDGIWPTTCSCDCASHVVSVFTRAAVERWEQGKDHCTTVFKLSSFLLLLGISHTTPDQTE